MADTDPAATKPASAADRKKLRRLLRGSRYKIRAAWMQSAIARGWISSRLEDGYGLRTTIWYVTESGLEIANG